jgi:copper(I)-binding protein
MLKRMLAVAASLLIATAVPLAQAAAQSDAIAVTRAWARATAGKAENGAAYLTVQSATADRLTGLSTPAARKAELHSVTMEGDVMKMRPLAGVDLPAGQPVTLKPGAEHIMLFGLTEPLQAGKSFPLTLHFEKAGVREVNVAVEAAGAMGPDKAAGNGSLPMPIPTGR